MVHYYVDLISCVLALLQRAVGFLKSVFNLYLNIITNMYCFISFALKIFVIAKKTFVINI